MRITDYLREGLVWVSEAGGRDALLRELSERVAVECEGVDSGGLLGALLERETKRSTATPEGVAFPHASVAGMEGTVVGAVLLKKGIDFGGGGVGGGRVDVVFVLVGPEGGGWEHLRLLGRLARVCHRPGALGRLRGVRDGAGLHRVLVEEDGLHV